jgi:hypothetical protein
MLKLRSIGINDYRVLEGGQRIGRIRFADERMPPVWLWNINIHLTGGLPMGSSADFNTAKVEFKAAWEVLKASTPPSLLATAYKAMILRGDND